MIETTQTVPVRCEIGKVWDYVQDIRRWADLMPGLQECDMIDADNSRWTLKVGVGGLVRTVRVKVHVDKWDGPGSVLFSFELEGDPVSGGGSYAAVASDPHETQMTLALQIVGSGPLAPMWEAMGTPLLPKFALAFAEQLASGVEANCGAATEGEAPVRKAGFFGWLLRLLQRLSARQS